MKPLYRYTLNQETGKVEKEVIREYVFIENTHFSSGYKNQSYYRHKQLGSYRYAYMDDFDKYKNNRVYSWSGDLENVRYIIARSLQDRIESLEEQTLRSKKLLERMKAWESQAAN